MKGKTIINVDIQPEYEDYIDFDLNKWIKFLNQTPKNNEIVFLFNGDSMGLIAEPNYKTWLIGLGLKENVALNATFYDKGYGFFRFYMDYGVKDHTIIDLVKFMLKHNINDSREINQEMWKTYADNKENLDDLMDLLSYQNDMIYIPELMDFLKKYSNIILTGGGVDDCLKEVEIALLSLNKNYNILSMFIY